MKRLWQASVREIAIGVVVEHAATLVQSVDGKVRLDYIVKGAEKAVTPVYTVAPGETCVGTYHTHPHPGGLTGVAFSAADIASAIVLKEWISLVQSGDSVFAMIRTDKTPNRVDRLVLKANFDQFFNAARHAGLSEYEAVWAANVGVCRLYGLALYKGRTDKNLEVIFKP
jgi:proteasome lid subunit RPN8/RPN11